MWNRLAYLGLGAALLCACRMLSPEAEGALQRATLTLHASKTVDSKALSLDENTLNAYWKDTESVVVYDDSGSWLGELDVFPGSGVKPSSATLSGTLDATGLAAGDHLELWIPRRMAGYTGQVGVLTGDNSIEEKYDYASARIEVAAVGENVITTTGTASFTNQQSIYRFGFKEDEETLNVKLFVVVAASNQMVQSIKNGEAVYGAFRVKPAAATTNLLYVAIRNESVGPSNTGDTYNFLVVGADQSAYLGAQNIPASLLDRQGKFISAQGVAVNQVILTKSNTPAVKVW